MKFPLILVAGSLLAACGGSGAPAVNDTPVVPADITPEPVDVTPEPVDVTPEPVEVTPEPVDVTPEPVTPPDPVNFVIESTDELGISFTEDTVTVKGVTYQIADLDEGFTFVRPVNDNISALSERNLSNITFGVVRIVNGDATAAVGLIVPEDDPLLGFIQAEEGAVYLVPMLNGVPNGTATFSGDYVGVISESDEFEREPGDRRVRYAHSIFGNAEFEIAFSDFLSESSLTGSITGRQVLQFSSGRSANNYIVNDIIIENGRFDDSGQLIADVSGGGLERINVAQGYNDAFEIVNSELSGQLGGEDGSVLAGTIAIDTVEYERAGVEGTIPLDTIDRTFREVGVFVARAD